jgi:hypothetical protein
MADKWQWELRDRTEPLLNGQLPEQTADGIGWIG